MSGIEKITFGELPSNAGRGIAGFTVLFNGEPTNNQELMDVIYALVQNKIGPYIGVSIEGTFSQGNERLMYIFCKTLKDYGYQLRVVTDGTMYPPWFKLVDNTMVVVTDKVNWMRFKADTIVYPLGPKEVQEPTLPKVEAGMMLYLDTENVPKKTIMEFMKNATKTWAVYRPTKPQHVWTIWRPEE